MENIDQQVTGKLRIARKWGDTVDLYRFISQKNKVKRRKTMDEKKIEMLKKAQESGRNNLFETKELKFVEDEYTIGDVTMEVGEQAIVLRDLDGGISVGIKVRVRPKGCDVYQWIGNYDVATDGSQIGDIINSIVLDIVNKIAEAASECNPTEWDKRRIVVADYGERNER